jgi:hypothetical protein
VPRAGFEPVIQLFERTKAMRLTPGSHLSQVSVSQMFQLNNLTLRKNRWTVNMWVSNVIAVLNYHDMKV